MFKLMLLSEHATRALANPIYCLSFSLCSGSIFPLKETLRSLVAGILKDLRHRPDLANTPRMEEGDTVS